MQFLQPIVNFVRAVASDGVTTKAAAATISDASFLSTPADGMIAVDTTNGRIVFRSGGAWKSTALTTDVPTASGVRPFFLS